jgi:uncharacterized protein YacL
MSWSAPQEQSPSQLSAENRYSKNDSRPASPLNARGINDGLARLIGGFWLVRVALLFAATVICYNLRPFDLPREVAAGAGLLFASLVLLGEISARRHALGEVAGGAAGTAAGIFVAFLTAMLISRTAGAEATKTCLEYGALLGFAYVGLVLGASRGEELLRPSVKSPLTAVPQREALKLLDTSVLIDGRIADICDTQFMDGVLGVPQFVLRELQTVADSSDSLKRQRGRRGLEILQRMQKMPQLDVRILEDDAAQAGEVDDKLVELARRSGAKIVTNDFNLNKVATVQGIAVLNVNLLANALKPAVLPGEPMRVLILREGKEPNQGVAYLDDGTMVVVDGGRRMINKMVDVIVTSVHQTTAGKMIFGRVDERAEPGAAGLKQAASAGATRGNSRLVSSEGPSVDRAPGSETPDHGNS